MKPLVLTSVLAICAMFTGIGHAEVQLQSKEALEGSWKVVQTRISGDASKANAREDTWIFKGGKVIMKHIPREGTYFDQAPVDYVVEDGKLKISIIGRPDKFETYSVESIESNKMTLIGKFHTYYDFVKQ